MSNWEAGLSWLDRQAEKEAKGNGQLFDLIGDPPEVDDFLGMEFPEEMKLLGPFYRQKIVHIAGPAGIGKTNIGLGMGHAFANGTALFNWSCPAPVPVLFVDGELSGRELQERLATYHWRDQRAPMRVMNAINWAASMELPHPNLSEPGWQAQIMEWAKSVTVVILDNVMSLVSVPGTSMSSDEFWKPVKDLNRQLKAAGKTVIWLDHTNDQGRVFGTKTKEWGPDLFIHLEKPENHDLDDGCRFIWRFTKSRGLHGAEVAPFEAGLMLDRMGKSVWTIKYLEDLLAMEVVEMYRKGKTQSAIANVLKISQSKVSRILAKQGEKA